MIDDQSSRVLLTALVFAASLASCAPSVQGPSGTGRPEVDVGIEYARSTYIRFEQITDQTPGTGYASFADCTHDQSCRDAAANTTFGVAALAVGISAVVWFISAFSHFGQAPQGRPAPAQATP